MSKLGLDSGQIARARHAASQIADTLDTFARARSTVSVERTMLRLYGIDGVDENDVPLPNILVEYLEAENELSNGVSRWLAHAIEQTGLSPQTIAERVAADHFDPLPDITNDDWKQTADSMADSALALIEGTAKSREQLLTNSEDRPQPWHYVIVATGNIYEDAVQARTAARAGADIIAVIRSTGQSLLDYVPYGPTTEGFGGTFATQENFRIVREALDDVGEELGRYIRLCNYCSGLCMPEIAAMGAIERLDVMLNDALYGILFRDINPQRTFIDQYVSRMINAYAGVIINTGEDNYLTTADAFEAGHTVLASQFLNEQIALRSGLPESQMGLGHAMEMNPTIEDGFLYELSQAQMTREIFPNAPLKYMPPTKYMTGNIFRGHLQDAMFNLIGGWTQQGIQLLGMMTEAMHTPHMGDRYLALENAQYIMNNTRSLADEIEFKQGGLIQSHAQSVLARSIDLLEAIQTNGLFETLAAGEFADVKRSKTGGKGLSGVFERGAQYYNPIETGLRSKLAL